MIFFLFSIMLYIGYAVLIVTISIGWWKLRDFEITRQLPGVKISVVVAVRNEAANIGALLHSLLLQDYPAELYEIIIVDDQSDDQTTRLAEDVIAGKKEAQNLKLVVLDVKNGSGKKAAIDLGIKVSSGELIVITDADCTAGNKWISSLSSFYKKNKPQMILAPVRMTEGGSFFGKLQSLEFTSLIASAAGSCNAGYPLLANGANMAFTRQAYETCGGFTGNLQYPSGDDMFLMISINKKFGPEAIRFLRSDDAIVNTPATKGVKPFIQQRLRWVSKTRGYPDPLLAASSIIVFLTNICLVAAAFSALFIPGYMGYFLVLYLIKLVLDVPLMLSYSLFQKKSALMWLFPLMELLNGFYTLIIGIAGNIGRFEWKGRNFSSNFHK